MDALDGLLKALALLGSLSGIGSLGWLLKSRAQRRADSADARKAEEDAEGTAISNERAEWQLYRDRIGALSADMQAARTELHEARQEMAQLVKYTRSMLRSIQRESPTTKARIMGRVKEPVPQMFAADE